MANTLPLINLTGTDWVNLNTASGIAVGTSIEIQNQSSQAVNLAISPLKPAIGFVGVVVPPIPFEIATISPDESIVWAYGTGSVSVQVS